MNCTITKLFLDSGTLLTDRHEKFLQMADLIEFKDCLFKYDPSGFYHPTSGKYNVLGISVPIQEYSFDELKELIGDSSINMVFSKHVDTVSASPGETEPVFFSREERESVIDLRETVTSLAQKGLIEIRDSKSWLATDPRSFRFFDQEDEWWEVDILGTSLGLEQTRRLLALYEA